MRIMICATLIAVAYFISAVAFAQSSSIKVNTNILKTDDLKKSDEKLKDIDTEITDARLRAQLGSKSKWSFKSHLTYSGSSISDPLNGVRPNYKASASMEEMTSLTGSVGINYRLSARDNLGAGTGLTVIDPLHGDPTKSAEDSRKGRSGELSRYQIATPYISWNRGYLIKELQMISGLVLAKPTSHDAVHLIKTSGFTAFNQTLQTNLGHSGWAAGFNFNIGKIFYSAKVNDPMLLAMTKMGKFKRPDISASLAPTAQYNFNDRYSFRTVLNYFQFVRYEDSSDNAQIEPWQSLGFGVSVTRDIYLFPNVEFTPKDIRSDRTNVALMANINLF